MVSGYGDDDWFTQEYSKALRAGTFWCAIAAIEFVVICWLVGNLIAERIAK